MKSKTPETIKTPVGTIEWAHLLQPDTKYKEAGEYKLDLLVDEDAAQPVIDAISAKYDEYYADQLKETGKPKLKRAALPWDVNDGVVKVKFRVKAVINTKKGPWDRKPNVTTPDGNEVICRIGNGSEGKVAFELYFWNTALGLGVTLQPRFVRITKLVPYKSPGDISPFDNEEEAPRTASKTGTDDEEITW